MLHRAELDGHSYRGAAGDGIAEPPWLRLRFGQGEGRADASLQPAQARRRPGFDLPRDGSFFEPSRASDEHGDAKVALSAVGLLLGVRRVEHVPRDLLDRSPRVKQVHNCQVSLA